MWYRNGERRTSGYALGLKLENPNLLVLKIARKDEGQSYFFLFIMFISIGFAQGLTESEKMVIWDKVKNKSVDPLLWTRNK